MYYHYFEHHSWSMEAERYYSYHGTTMQSQTQFYHMDSFTLSAHYTPAKAQRKTSEPPMSARLLRSVVASGPVCQIPVDPHLVVRCVC